MRIERDKTIRDEFRKTAKFKLISTSKIEVIFKRIEKI